MIFMHGVFGTACAGLCLHLKTSGNGDRSLEMDDERHAPKARKDQI